MDEKMKVFSNGTKHIVLTCIHCGKFNGYKPQNKPITEKQAMSFKLTWKPYEGYELQTVDDLYLETLLKYTKSEYLAKIYQTEMERRKRIWEEMRGY